MIKRRLLLLAGRYLLMLATLIPSTCNDLTSKIGFYEVTIPQKLEPRDGREIEGHMSYIILIEGRQYAVHLKQNRESLSSNFTVFSYTDEGKLLVEQPYIRNDCYYYGTLEGIEDSVVALSTCSGLRGFLQTKNWNYGIQPMESSSSFQHLVYRMKDLDFEEDLCGVISKDAEIDLTIFTPNTARTNPVITAKRRYLELAIIVDYEWYVYAKRNSTKVQNDIVQIVNLADAMFDAINIDIILLGVEIWTQKSLINVTRGAEDVLNEFKDWKQKDFQKRMHSDIATLVLNRSYNTTIGLAYVGTVCVKTYSVSFISVAKMRHRLCQMTCKSHNIVFNNCLILQRGKINYMKAPMGEEQPQPSGEPQQESEDVIPEGPVEEE
ncbi:disintegrin and metalloproteinase domain-containing protein 9-like [Rhinatrema bivittatum]|uniref:disintegrin and metalloproteinase domain-containing protein 9-like n=1 Tax=Rhinatrema bivittatum TaxID=194408 RepID=UPI001127049F|nr:disintegrin and metalloproteinase domain-containing protein 9-like [Rhinatrema bivittatum]